MKPTDDQIKHMVDRFLGWRLPEAFHPDAGITFKPTFNEHTAHPMKHEPSGTNLFNATQADAMVRYMVADMPGPDLVERLCRALAFHLIESELTLSHAEGDDLGYWAGECQKARSLIAEAGFDIDKLYPILERPTSGDAPQ